MRQFSHITNSVCRTAGLSVYLESITTQYHGITHEHVCDVNLGVLRKERHSCHKMLNHHDLFRESCPMEYAKIPFNLIETDAINSVYMWLVHSKKILLSIQNQWSEVLIV